MHISSVVFQFAAEAVHAKIAKSEMVKAYRLMLMNSRGGQRFGEFVLFYWKSRVELNPFHEKSATQKPFNHLRVKDELILMMRELLAVPGKIVRNPFQSHNSRAHKPLAARLALRRPPRNRLKIGVRREGTVSDDILETWRLPRTDGGDQLRCSRRSSILRITRSYIHRHRIRSRIRSRIYAGRSNRMSDRQRTRNNDVLLN